MITLSVLLHMLNIVCWIKHLHNVKFNNVPFNMFEENPTLVTMGLVVLTGLGTIQIIALILIYCP